MIVALAKAIPAAQKIFEQSVDLYYSQQEGQDQDQVNAVQQEREGITAALTQPGMTDENRRALRKRLIALSKL